jgi:membrane associated rhomboid family serine protease
MLSITLIIIILTTIVSVTSFKNEKTTNDLIFYPPAVTNQNQWYRFWSCALIHADFLHLFFNMFTLYSFGGFVENAFQSLFPGVGKLLYLALYLVAQFVCLLPTYLKNKNDYQYRSLGASGAVSAVVFVGIVFYPTAMMGFFPIPPIIPAFIFGPLFLVVSSYLDKKGGGNVNHSAHLWGAVAGVIFILVISYAFGSGPYLIGRFIDQVSGYFR